MNERLYLIDRICPECHKTFTVLHPDQWAYKAKPYTFFCSWRCLRATQKRKEENRMKKVETKRTRMKPEEMAEAVRLWRTGDPGLNQYLTDHGITHITKWKNNQKARYGKAEPVSTVKVDGPLRIETKEPEKVKVVPKESEKQVPLQYDGYTVCCIESKTFGRFYWDRDHNHLDWTTAEGEEVSFTPAGWKMFLEELPKVAEILGVEL